MNIIQRSATNVSDALKHYLCMRMRYRNGVLNIADDDDENGEKLNTQLAAFCPDKRCDC